MVQATLHPRTSSTQELALALAQRRVREAVTCSAERTRMSRQRLLTRVRSARARAFRRGYEEGLAAAQDELRQIAQQVRSQYSSVCETAYHDVRSLAVEICEELLQGQAPELLLPWLDRALAVLKSQRSVTVRVAQRYASSAAAHLRAHHAGVMLVAAPASQAAEFVASTDSGEISFAWRTALDELLRARQQR